MVVNMDMIYEIKNLRVKPMEFNALIEIVDGTKRLSVRFTPRDVIELLSVLSEPVFRYLEFSSKSTKKELARLEKKLGEVRKRISEEEERGTHPNSVTMTTLRREEEKLMKLIEKHKKIMDCITELDSVVFKFEILLSNYLALTKY